MHGQNHIKFVYLLDTKLKHNNARSLSIRIYCYVLRQFPTRHPPAGGSGYLSRYSDSLRAGRSGDRMRVGASFSAPLQTGSGVHPAFCTVGTGSFSGTRQPKRGVDHSHPSREEVKEIIELYLYSFSRPSWSVLGWNLTLHLSPSNYPIIKPANSTIRIILSFLCFTINLPEYQVLFGQSITSIILTFGNIVSFFSVWATFTPRFFLLRPNFPCQIMKHIITFKNINSYK